MGGGITSARRHSRPDQVFEKEIIMVGQDLDINCFRSEKQTSKITFGEARGILRKADSGEKPNKCNQCDYASSRADTLRAHLKTHSGEKSNKCNQCDYASSEAGNLRSHMKIHSGEK